MNFIKDFEKEIYNGFYEGILSDDIGEIITVNFNFFLLKYRKYTTSKNGVRMAPTQFYSEL